MARVRPWSIGPGPLAGWLAGEKEKLYVEDLIIFCAPNWKFPRNVRFGTGPTHLVGE